jgi:Restriction alleviation protein Lar
MTYSQQIEIDISKLLEPCPFCGCEAGIKAVSGGGIQCHCRNEDCGAMLPSWLDFEKDENVIEKLALAIEYWNKRVNK